MTTKNTSTIQEKIQKLLALATSPVEAEATAAMEKAQELLAKHNLSMADVLKSGSEKKFVIVEAKVGDIFAHKRRLGQAVGKLYFCKYFFRVIPTQSKRKNVYNREQHCFAGEQHNADIALMMFNYLSDTIDRLAKEGADKMDDKKKYWSFQTAFKTAASRRLAERIMEKLQAATAPSTSSGNLPALASLYDRAQSEIDDYLDSMMSFTITKTKKQKYHTGGYVAGHAAGNKIGLDTQVTSAPKPLLN